MQVVQARYYGVGVLAAAALGCGAAAHRNHTFYDWADPIYAPEVFERAYRPLDAPEQNPGGGFIGVSVLEDRVHLSRPKNWRLQNASNDDGNVYVQYISPNAYSFAIYERPDSGRDAWSDILKRYESDVATAKARIVEQPVPMAAAQGQGRAYGIERDVVVSGPPLLGRSREFVVRGDRHVVLVQIVYESEDLADVDKELLRAVGTLEVL